MSNDPTPINLNNIQDYPEFDNEFKITNTFGLQRIGNSHLGEE